MKQQKSKLDELQVFVSWSGGKANVLAHGISTWLPSIIPTVKTFFSPRIEGGAIWIASIEEQIRASKFAILCVSRENQTSQWLNFEAGSFWTVGSSGVPVCPLLLDLEPREITGPMGIFQAQPFNERGVKNICRQLAELSNVDKEQVMLSFDAIWPRLKREVESGLKKLARE